jgi:hypothetical protein
VRTDSLIRVDELMELFASQNKSVAESGTSLTAANELAIRLALKANGVDFIDENGGGPGVRLRKRKRAKQTK